MLATIFQVAIFQRQIFDLQTKFEIQIRKGLISFSSFYNHYSKKTVNVKKKHPAGCFFSYRSPGLTPPGDRNFYTK